jgi:hypothetical protein
MPNELRISRRERAARESAKMRRISREAVGWMRVSGSQDSMLNGCISSGLDSERSTDPGYKLPHEEDKQKSTEEFVRSWRESWRIASEVNGDDCCKQEEQP